jgi:hypothetical protein
VTDTPKGILLRLSPAMRAELEQVAFEEHTTVTELLRQGAVIRVRMPKRDKVGELLDRLGYQPQRPPGRPASKVNGTAPEPAPGPAAAPPAAPAGDGWELEEPV